MSGGSFNYVADRRIEDLLASDEDLVAIRDALAAYPNSERAVERVNVILDVIAAARRKMDLAERLRAGVYDVLHAVEWHHSADLGPDDVAKALAKMDAPPLSQGIWRVCAGSPLTDAWCTTFEDAVKHAAKAGEGATIEGPWMERLVLATPATGALAEVEAALLAAVKRNDGPTVIALAHALTALRTTPATPTR